MSKETTPSMTTEKTDKAKPTEKPKVRDAFLADLIIEFGSEYGVELYQSGDVTKEDLASFTALREKFGVDVKQRPKATPSPSAAFGKRQYGGA